MMKLSKVLFLFTFFSAPILAQEYIALNEENWDFDAKAFVLENYKGKDAIYIQQGSITLKDVEFLDGTIEFDVFLTERQGFPGVGFRQFDDENEESFYLRPHLSGMPDANQTAPTVNGLSAWQLYFGERYSFAYDYNFDDWTHVKLLVNGDTAQVFMDYSETPQLTWKLKHEPRAGKVNFGGSFAPMHFANIKITQEKPELMDYVIPETKPLDGVIQRWQISDKFLETRLEHPDQLAALIDERQWPHSVEIEENNAANISWAVSRRQQEGDTVFARLTIDAAFDQVKLFEFGYSDRVVAILNSKPIYRGTNKWRSRDYRYLGTIGFFDAIYLDLKEGRNALLLAVSEDFGGWGVTGRFADSKGIKIGLNQETE